MYSEPFLRIFLGNLCDSGPWRGEYYLVDDQSDFELKQVPSPPRELDFLVDLG